jgi:hypothetical protein
VKRLLDGVPAAPYTMEGEDIDSDEDAGLLVFVELGIMKESVRQEVLSSRAASRAASRAQSREAAMSPPHTSPFSAHHSPSH